jgi:hypothetical protein
MGAVWDQRRVGMNRQNLVGSVFIGLMLIIGVSHVQGAMVPFQLNHMDTSLMVKPVPVISNQARVPLAVPSFGHTTTTQEHVPDLLPVSERMYQDRHWGYWLGFSYGNGYSFVLTGQSPYWGSTSTAGTVPPPTQAPEPASLILLGLGGAWMAARTRRGRCAVKIRG